MSNKIKNDKEFILELYKINSNIIAYCGNNMLNDYDIVKLMNANNSSTNFLKNVGDKIKNNKDYMMTWIKVEGACLKYCSSELQDNEEFVLEAIRTNPYSLYYASDRLKNDKMFIMKTVTMCGLCLSCLNKTMRADKEIVMKAVEKDTLIFDEYLFNKIPDNIDTYYGNAPLAYAVSTLMTDIDIILKAAETCKDNLMFTNIYIFKLYDFDIEKINDIYQLTLTLNNRKIIVGKSQDTNRYVLYEFIVELFVDLGDYSVAQCQEWFNIRLLVIKNII